MTSATWPAEVRRLASSYMTDPVTVFIGTLDLAAVETVTQYILFVEDEDEKRVVLSNFFKTMDPDDKVIVFVGKKSRVDDIASDLSLRGFICQSIHGDRDQSDREQALLDLKTGEVKILIATDVASRGIDILDITHVFNFDFPRNIEEYVHRVGRTGRAGRSGTAISLMEKRGSDWKSAKELIEIMKKGDQEIPQELYEMAARYERFQERRAEEKAARFGGGGGGGGPAGGGDGCFRCGEPGHISRDCHNSEAGGGGRGGGRGGGEGCYRCGHPGHISRNCPQAGGGRSGGSGGANGSLNHGGW